MFVPGEMVRLAVMIKRCNISHHFGRATGHTKIKWRAELEEYGLKICRNMALSQYIFIQGVPTKSARFNFVTNVPFIKKVLIFLFQYKLHILQLIAEHNIRKMSPTTQQSRGERQCAHFKSCALVGTPYITTEIFRYNWILHIIYGMQKGCITLIIIIIIIIIIKENRRYKQTEKLQQIG